jgi:phosphoribosylformylglycinamidine cyclo-ligase
MHRGTWPELPVFGVMQKLGNVSEHEMFRTFNMGIGMVVICSPDAKSFVTAQIDAFEIGKIVAGSNEVSILEGA